MPCGIIVNFYPKFATIERCFYDADKREILTSDGKPFLYRQLGAGELARAPKTRCFLSSEGAAVNYAQTQRGIRRH